MELNQFSTVDIVLDKANDNFIQKQTISAGDRDGRSLTLQVTDAGSIGEVPGLTANLLWTNHSSGVSDLSAFSVVDRLTSVFKIEYPQNMLTAGKVTAQIQLLHNGKVTHSKKFEIIVLDVAGNLKGVLQTAEYTALVEALAKVNEFETDIAVLSSSKADKTTLNETNNLVQGNYDQIQTTKKELNTRIDRIIATPTTVSEQEIIDARQGETSLGANLTKIKQSEYKYKRNITSEDNLENIMESGIYFAFNTSPVGTPSDIINQPYILRVDNFSEAYCLQTIYSYLDPSIIYTRYVYTWATPKATPFVRTGGGYQHIINNETNLNTDKLPDGLYWVLVGSQPLNAPSQLASTAYLIKQELFHERNYAIQTAYDIKKPEKMYKRWVYYYAGESTNWATVGDDAATKPLAGKKLLTLGDSITFGATSTNHYQDKIADITGAEVINAGYSGAKYALIAGHEPWNEFSFYQRSLDYDLTDIEYIFGMYGTNDFGNHVPIGTMESDEYTVKGALVKGLTNLFTKKPNLKLFFSTPIFRATYDGTDIVDLDIKTNDLGLTIHDYSQAVIDVCKKFRIPVFDAQKECGINKLNHHIYLSDKLHPNNDGNDLIGTRYGRFIIQYS